MLFHSAFTSAFCAKRGFHCYFQEVVCIVLLTIFINSFDDTCYNTCVILAFSMLFDKLCLYCSYFLFYPVKNKLCILLCILYD